MRAMIRIRRVLIVRLLIGKLDIVVGGKSSLRVKVRLMMGGWRR